MEKIRLGRTDLMVTRWALGGIPLSTVMGGNSEAAISSIIHAALDRGVNFIDTSRVYMDSETNIGEAIRGRRDKVVLASKSINRTRDEVLADVEESLVQLGTDCIEIYQMHALKPHEVAAAMGPGGALEALQQAREQGMIRWIGLTSHHVGVLQELIESGAFDTIMFPFNVIEREPARELIPRARELDIGTLVMKPVAGGAIEDRPRAFRFFNSYAVDVILNGVSNVAELEENLQHAASRELLGEQELAALEASVAELGSAFCRRCSYCLPCPSDILIPDMIHVFWQALRNRSFDDLPPEKREMGRNLLPWLEACEGCGACEERCPYELPTRARVEQLKELFAGR